MLTHPQFDQIAFSLGPLDVRWYGLMYLVAFLLFFWMGRLRIARQMPGAIGWQVRELEDLLFFGVLGVVLGGRLGYILFYKPGYFLSHPLEIFSVWQGGMAFHGGFLGVLVAGWWFARKTHRTFFQVMDFVAPLVPFGLAAGRLGNFINGELWGRIADPARIPWAMWFPQADAVPTPRHPSQLYQFAGEGLALLLLLWWFARKPRPVGAISAMFLMGYGGFRFLAEYAREPDSFLGYLSLGLSMGQWLSLPMIVAGGILMRHFYKQRPAEVAGRSA